MTFRAWFHRTDPQNIGGQFGLFEKHFSKANEPQRNPRNIFQTEKFQDYFEKRAPVYSLEAPLLGLAKSVYYTYSTVYHISAFPQYIIRPFTFREKDINVAAIM